MEYGVTLMPDLGLGQLLLKQVHHVPASSELNILSMRVTSQLPLKCLYSLSLKGLWRRLFRRKHEPIFGYLVYNALDLNLLHVWGRGQVCYATAVRTKPWESERVPWGWRTAERRGCLGTEGERTNWIPLCWSALAVVSESCCWPCDASDAGLQLGSYLIACSTSLTFYHKPPRWRNKSG